MEKLREEVRRIFKEYSSKSNRELALEVAGTTNIHSGLGLISYSSKSQSRFMEVAEIDAHRELNLDAFTRKKNEYRENEHLWVYVNSKTVDLEVLTEIYDIWFAQELTLADMERRLDEIMSRYNDKTE